MSDYFQMKDGILSSYDGREESIVVPEGIHTIAEDAFKACTSLKKIVLPHSLRSIMPRAFKGCRNLIELEIPEGVSYVGEYAFHRCHSIQSIKLPTTVCELGSCAFLYCDSLREIEIPGVQRLGRQAFLNDTLLERLVISKDLQEDCIRDVFTSCGRISEISFGDGNYFHISNLVEAASSDSSFPSVIRTIAADILTMFELDGHRLVRFLTNLKHVEIPEGITTIGKSCFFDRRGILSITLPASLKTMESRAFCNCICLEQVTFHTRQISIHEDAFKNCTALKRVILPDGYGKSSQEFSLQGLSSLSQQSEIPLIQTIRRQVLGNFRLCGTILLKYLGSESRVIVPDGVTAIAQDAFAGKESINRIILPKSVREIGAGAFSRCLLLQTIDLPPLLKRIGAGAFENCVKLLRISLPESIRTIEKRTFCRCHSLAKITFGADLCEIGEQAFYGCSSLAGISLPSKLHTIGTMAFYRCNALESVTLPESIQKIGSLAFAQSGVREARIFGSGTGFGTDLFAHCKRLVTLSLENSVRHIPDKLAYGCTALTKVLLPQSIQSIGRDALMKTPFLAAWKQEMQGTFLTDAQGHADPATVPENGIFWDGSGLSGKINFSSQTKIIAGGAFYGNTEITYLNLPDSITSLGKAAFKGCSALEEVDFPAGINKIEDELFSGCIALQTIHSIPPLQFVGKRAFLNCGLLQKLPLRTVEHIGAEAFCNCKNLKYSSMDHVTYIGENAFENTIYLINFNTYDRIYGPDLLPDSFLIDYTNYSPTYFGTVLASGNHSENELTIREGTTYIAPYAFFCNVLITKLILPESLQTIGEGAFLGCCALTEIIFPDSGCEIKAHAFEKCTALKQLRLKKCNLGKSAFAYCTALENISFSGITALPEGAFEGCCQLEEFTCDADAPIKEISASCFQDCKNLSRAALSNVETIAPYAFECCDSLKNIELKEDAFLDVYAFKDCGNMEEITISGRFGNLFLREYALSGCTSLKHIITGEHSWEFTRYPDLYEAKFPETIQKIFYSAFSCFDIEKGTELCGYHGSARRVTIPDGITRIEAEVFYDILMLEEIHIPESVEYIGARAFYKTAWLEEKRRHTPMVIVNHMVIDASACVGEVTVPEDVRMVCGWAFANGMQITKIHFLSEKTRVEPFAFRNCIYMEEIELADGTCIKFKGIADRNRELPPLAKQAVFERLNCFKTDDNGKLVECTGNISELLVADGITTIGAHAFLESNLLTTITLPKTVTTIENAAFANCKWLKSVRQQRQAEDGKKSTPNKCPDDGTGIQAIGDMAFSGCGMLEHVELSNALTKIGIRAFEDCVALREILLPEGLTEIPDRAFFRCHSLTHVHIPSTVKRIGKEAFAFCSQLSISSFPANVVVCERAFVGTIMKKRFRR